MLSCGLKLFASESLVQVGQLVSAHHPARFIPLS